MNSPIKRLTSPDLQQNAVNWFCYRLSYIHFNTGTETVSLHFSLEESLKNLNSTYKIWENRLFFGFFGSNIVANVKDCSRYLYYFIFKNDSIFLQSINQQFFFISKNTFFFLFDSLIIYIKRIYLWLTSN